jgi:hypothetical protein
MTKPNESVYSNDKKGGLRQAVLKLVDLAHEGTRSQPTW